MHSLFPKHDPRIFLDTPSGAFEPVSFLPRPLDTSASHLKRSVLTLGGEVTLGRAEPSNCCRAQLA